jgi:hypothetical protein
VGCYNPAADFSAVESPPQDKRILNIGFVRISQGHKCRCRWRGLPGNSRSAAEVALGYIPDQAASKGTCQQIETTFRKTYEMLVDRIGAFAAKVA